MCKLKIYTDEKRQNNIYENSRKCLIIIIFFYKIIIIIKEKKALELDVHLEYSTIIWIDECNFTVTDGYLESLKKIIIENMK